MGIDTHITARTQFVETNGVKEKQIMATQPMPGHELGQAQTTMSTQEVLERHLKCRADGDLAGFLADFSPEIVVFRPLGSAGAVGVAQGLTAIGPVFAALFAEFARPGTRFEIREQAIEG